MKRFACILLCALLCALCIGLAVSAEKYQVSELDITMDVPSDFYMMTEDQMEVEGESVDGNDANEDSVVGSLNEFESDVHMLGATADGKQILTVSSSKALFEDINSYGASELDMFILGLTYGLENKGYTVSEKKTLTHSETKFVKIKYGLGDSSVYAMSYVTVMNYKTICVELAFLGETVSSQQEIAYDGMIRGIQFGDTYNKTATHNTATNSSIENYSNYSTYDSYTSDSFAYNTYYKWQSDANRTNTTIVTLLITALLALIPGFVARGRGRRFWVWYLMALLLNPVLLTIIVLCKNKVEPDYASYQYEYSATATLWNCRLCGTTNEAHYKVCQNCGNERYPGDDPHSAASPGIDTWQCQNCGTQNKNNYAQCKKCGKYKGQ